MANGHFVFFTHEIPKLVHRVSLPKKKLIFTLILRRYISRISVVSASHSPLVAVCRWLPLVTRLKIYVWVLRLTRHALI